MAELEHDDLRAAVDELWLQSPCPVLGSHGNGVLLWAWAEDVASGVPQPISELGDHRRLFALPRPSSRTTGDFDTLHDRLDQLDPAEFEVFLDGLLTVASGHDGDHALIVSNHTREPTVVSTNGRITAHVVDPNTGRMVGISTMGQTLPGVPFRAEPGENVSIPLRVGTASVDPELGLHGSCWKVGSSSSGVAPGRPWDAH